MNPASRERILGKLRADLGPDIQQALDDPRTVEVMVNADGRIWHERLGQPMQCIGELPAQRAQAVIQTVASFTGQEVTVSTPIVECELPPNGSRFAGQIPPVVPAPTFAIRKPTSAQLQLQDYVQQSALSDTSCGLLRDAVRSHRNILVTGGTGSGKTTFVNALIAEMVAQRLDERVVIIEDTRELQCAAQNVVRYRATEHVSMTALLRTTLRMRPDRILVGEVRGPEALDLLMAWNTGHEGGIATCHANNALAGLGRLEMLVSAHPAAPRTLQPLIAEAVDLVVHIRRTPTGREISELLRVDKHGPHGYCVENLQKDPRP